MSINEQPKKPLQIATAFSGGLAAVEFALRYEDIEHEIVFACEWNTNARKQYLRFHGAPKNQFYISVDDNPLGLYGSLLYRLEYMLQVNKKDKEVEKAYPSWAKKKLKEIRKDNKDIVKRIRLHQKKKVKFLFFSNVLTNEYLKRYIGKLDNYAWGSPCQNLSMSGDRAGLDGSQSSHFFHGARIQGIIKPPVFIFENVTGLFSSNDGKDYKIVCDTFRNQGYHIHTTQMNAKDYGDPQNRDRIFIIGFLNEREYHKYKEPEPIHLKKRLKDVLQKWVPEKYFLSQKMIDGFVRHTENQLIKHNGKSGFVFKPSDGNKIANCLHTVPGNKASDDYIKVGYINQNTQASSVSSTEGIINTLTAGSHGYAQGYIKLDQVGQIGSSQADRVYSTDGIACTVKASGGGAKTGLYHIKSATKDGYEVAHDYDCIDLERPNSPTRRGRVGNGYAQTLQTHGNLGVIYGHMIRRLTPYETFRLQGVRDEDINKIFNFTTEECLEQNVPVYRIVQILRDTALYMITGNAINVTVARFLYRSIYKKELVQEKVSLLDFL